MKKHIIIFIATMLTAAGASAQSGIRYPYIQKENNDGPVVVSRDVAGGVKRAALAANGADGKVAAGFQIGLADVDGGAQIDFATAQGVCDAADRWRLPSKGELQLIWLMGGAAHSNYTDMAIEHVAGGVPLYSLGGGFDILANEGYWSYTANGSDIWSVNMSDGSMATTQVSENLRVRCVRDNATNYGTGIAYTKDRANSMFFLATEDANNGNTMTWNDIDVLTCPYPYYVPDKQQNHLVWVYRDGFEGHDLRLSTYYWSSTSSSYDVDIAWCIRFSDSHMGIYDKNTYRYTRCIKDNEDATKVYPYVDDSDSADGPIVVSADNDGGVAITVLSSSPAGYNNTLAARFQVANEDLPGTYDWSAAVAACTALDGGNKGWRLPTQRESHLIWLLGGAPESRYDAYNISHLAGDSPMNDKNIFANFIDMPVSEYRTATINSDNTLGWLVYYGHGSGGWNTLDALRPVRCVRDR